MTDSERDSTEKEIRKTFETMAYRIGFGVFFFGLGVQSSMIHAAQMTHYDSGNLHFGVLLVDTALFFIGAASILRGMKSLGKALIMIARLNPNKPKD